MIYCNTVTIPRNTNERAWWESLQTILRRMEADESHEILSISFVYEPDWVDVLVVSRRVV